MTNGKRNYRVLVVDDGEKERGVAVAFVNGYAQTHGLEAEILQAYDGANALEIMARLKREGKGLELVISDMDMPKKTGLDVLEKGSELFPHAGYIIWSGVWSGNRDWFMGLVTASGATALDKPTGKDVFFAAIAKYIP